MRRMGWFRGKFGGSVGSDELIAWSNRSSRRGAWGGSSPRDRFVAIRFHGKGQACQLC